MEILTNPETTASAEGTDTPGGDFSRPLCSRLSRRQAKRLAKKKTIAHVLNLVRDWQADGMPSSDNGIEPDAEEAWKVVAWLQRRLRIHSANDPHHQRGDGEASKSGVQSAFGA
jgi:hypothetical protein